jgi:alpha-methylacyl-CoA racemase
VGGGAEGQPRGPLLGVRFVELAGLGPGPFGAMLLADLGADVVRIDRAAGDDPPLSGDPRAEVTARGRRSIAPDLKQTSDLEVARGLLDSADVLVDPYRPGIAERLGLGPEESVERNPRLINARMTGWGQSGPLAGTAAHDLNDIALAGALRPMGAPDQPSAPPLNLAGDFGGGGMLLAFDAAAALYERERSGRGQIVDVAILDGVAILLASLCQLAGQGQWSRERGTNWRDGAAPWYRAYRTADGRFVTVGRLEAKFYRLLLSHLGLSEESWPQWGRGRWPELRSRMENIFAQRTLDQWCDELAGTDDCFAPALRVEEAAVDPHLAARSVYVEHDGVLQPAPSPRFSQTTGAITDRHRSEAGTRRRSSANCHKHLLPTGALTCGARSSRTFTGISANRFVGSY